MKEKQVKYLTIGVFVLAIINIGLLVLIMLPKPAARMHRDQVHKMNNKGARFLSKSLDLTPDQQEKFKSLFQQHKSRKDSLTKVIMYNKKLLAEQITDGNTNKQAIDSIMVTLTDAHRSNELEMYNHFTQLADICTPQQRDKLKRLIHEHQPPHPGQRSF